jgi:hypothetical protein
MDSAIQMSLVVRSHLLLLLLVSSRSLVLTAVDLPSSSSSSLMSHSILRSCPWLLEDQSQVESSSLASSGGRVSSPSSSGSSDVWRGWSFLERDRSEIIT